MTIRVLLVDNRVMLRQGLRTLLETETDLEVVGEAGSVRQALDLAAAIDADVVVLDLGLPELDGNTATQRLHHQYPELRIVVLSSDENDAGVVPAVRAGAIGVVSTTAPIDTLLETIRLAADGHVTFSTAVSLRLVEELRAPVESPERLTGRELEVLECVAQGFSNKEIAWQLRISEKTVKSHVSTILGKFGLESRTQAALHATHAGLVSIERSVSSTPHRLREHSLISLEARRHRSPALVAVR